MVFVGGNLRTKVTYRRAFDRFGREKNRRGRTGQKFEFLPSARTIDNVLSTLSLGNNSLRRAERERKLLRRRQNRYLHDKDNDSFDSLIQDNVRPSHEETRLLIRRKVARSSYAIHHQPRSSLCFARNTPRAIIEDRLLCVQIASAETYGPAGRPYAFLPLPFAFCPVGKQTARFLWKIAELVRRS